MPLYFAYGSDADLDRVALNCGLAVAVPPLAVAGLVGSRLVFRRNGVEDLEDDPARSLWGGLFELTELQVEALLTVARNRANPAGAPALVPPDVPATPQRVAVTVRVQTPGRANVARAAGLPPLVDDTEVAAVTIRLAAPAPAAIRPRDAQLRAVLLAALRCNLPASYAAGLGVRADMAPRVRVADIMPAATDNAGMTVARVYAKAEPFFAVYSTDRDSVQIMYADDPLLAQRQRERLSPLGSLRWRIYGLMEHRRETPGIWTRLQAKLPKLKPFMYTLFVPWAWTMTALSFMFPGRVNQRNEDVNVRVAAALAEALAGGENAAAELQEVYDDLKAKRISAARMEYVLWSAIISMIGTVIFLWLRHDHGPFAMDKRPLWLATASGVVGAFFSIATAIRGRTVAIALARWDNRIDAVLRVAVGAIGAGTLILILQTKFLADTGVGGPNFVADSSWQAVALIGFAAGFTERLVPDLLARGNANRGGAAGK